MRIIFLNSWYAKAGKVYFKFVKDQSTKIDVYCFQEIQPELFSKLEILLPRYTGSYLTDNRVEILGYKYGKAIFVKKGLQFHTFDKLYTYRNTYKDTGFSQPFDLEINNITIHINSVHGKGSPSHKKDTPARIRQSETLINYFKNKTGPKIIGGDFNLMPDTQSVEIFERAGYRNLVKEFNIKETRNRLAWEFFKDDPLFVKQHFADYCFVSPEVKVNSFSVPNVEVSDHEPLILDFEI